MIKLTRRSKYLIALLVVIMVFVAAEYVYIEETRIPPPHTDTCHNIPFNPSGFVKIGKINNISGKGVYHFNISKSDYCINLVLYEKYTVSKFLVENCTTSKVYGPNYVTPMCLSSTNTSADPLSSYAGGSHNPGLQTVFYNVQMFGEKSSYRFVIYAKVKS
jgi:hypothetical protein